MNTDWPLRKFRPLTLDGAYFEATPRNFKPEGSGSRVMVRERERSGGQERTRCYSQVVVQASNSTAIANISKGLVKVAENRA